MKYVVVVIAALAVSACTPLGVVGAGIALGVSAYCSGTSDAAKTAARTAVSGGKQLIACSNVSR